MNRDSFLLSAVSGFKGDVMATLSKNASIRAYQLKVALYIASAHARNHLAKTLIAMGVRHDLPVGEVGHFRLQKKLTIECLEMYMARSYNRGAQQTLF